MQQISQVRKRTPGKLAKTNYPNEIVDYLETIRPPLNTGQIDDRGLARRTIDLVKVISAAAGGGKYNGTVWTHPGLGAASASGNLTEAELGIAGNDCLVFNAQEVGKSTHDLTTGTPVSKIFVALLLGFTSAGLPVYGINGDDWEACT